jgi:hypothetical protein
MRPEGKNAWVKDTAHCDWKGLLFVRQGRLRGVRATQEAYPWDVVEVIRYVIVSRHIALRNKKVYSSHFYAYKVIVGLDIVALARYGGKSKVIRLVSFGKWMGVFT